MMQNYTECEMTEILNFLIKLTHQLTLKTQVC